ncbi:unnamed protein product [Scytosiphon promiscuus]
MGSVKGNDVLKQQSTSKPSQHGMRRSCETCRRKKKRCDGEQPCSRCTRTRSECSYNKSLWHHSDEPRHLQQRRPHQSDREVVYSREHRFHPTPCAPTEDRVLPFKRCRLRASPATGLVGMRENAFLSDFFGCIGFLPLANESQIREAMVRIMIPAAPQEETALNYDGGDEDELFGTLLGERTSNDVSGTNQAPEDPLLCTFWCAVAMGALAKGSPFEAVMRYGQLAQEALAASRSGSTYAKLAQASATMAYLYNFMGDTANFCEYLESSESFLQAAIEQGSTYIHAGLPDLIVHCRRVGNVDSGPMKARSTRGKARPQCQAQETIATKADLFRFVTQSFRTLDKAIYAKVVARCPGDLQGSSACGSSHRQCCSSDPLARKLSDSIATVFETAYSRDFWPLQDALERRSNRGGVIDLFVNGTLVYESAIKGDLCAALEKLDRSVDACERYPGLCRCMMWCHMTHRLLAILAEIDDYRAPKMYERLRGAFNSCRASHSVPVPPLNEWQGMATICTDLECRAIEALVKSGRMKAFTTLSINCAHDSAGLPHTVSKPQSKIPNAKGAHVEMSDTAQASPGSPWISSNNAMGEFARRPDPVGATCCAGAAVPPPSFRVYPIEQSDQEAESSCIVNGEASKVLDSLSRPTGVHGRQADKAWLEDDELGATDLLDVVNAVVTAVHSSEVEG